MCHPSSVHYRGARSPVFYALDLYLVPLQLSSTVEVALIMYTNQNSSFFFLNTQKNQDVKFYLQSFPD